MKNQNKIKIIKITLTVVILVALAIFFWKIAPFMMDLSTTEGQITFKNKINSMGFLGLLLLFSLQVLQILLVVLPGEPFEVLAGMCYGTWGGWLFITVSILITTIIIFFSVRKLGEKYLYNFFKKEKVEKVMNSKLLKNETNLEIILCLIFFLPGTPKDLFVYLGGLLPVKPLRFILIATLVRFPSVITSTMVGANISNGNWKTSLLIYLITFVITAIILVILKIRDKNKELIVNKVNEMIPNINLTGQWSLDIMQNGDDFWLIDMATADCSALNDCIPKEKLNKVPENWIPNFEQY